jgi:hypothetical protein
MLRLKTRETPLFQQAFTEDCPEAGKNRLRLMDPEDSDDYRSAQHGARALAEGLYKGIRNPLSHGAWTDISEHRALEYLAAFSILARWVDESNVEHAEGIHE